MHAVLPIFRQRADTFWTTPKGLEVLEEYVSRVVASYSRTSVVSDWKAALEIARRAGAETIVMGEGGGERFHLPGMEAARSFFASTAQSETQVYLNFRSLDAPQLALQAVSEQGGGPWTCLASGSQPHDHPCQAFCMEQALALDIVHMFAEDDVYRPPGLPEGAVLTRPFSLDWSFLGVHDAAGGPFFRFAKHPHRGMAVEAVADQQNLPAQNSPLFIREDHFLARMALRPEAEAGLPPHASPYHGPSLLAGATANPARSGFRPLLYRDLSNNKTFLRFQAPPRSTRLRVFVFGSAGFLAYHEFPCAPGENTLALNEFHSPSQYTHMIIGLCGWTRDAVSPEFTCPFPGGDLWSRETSGELRDSVSGKIMHGRQAFPRLLELDGSFFVFRQGHGPGLMPERGHKDMAIRQLPQGVGMQVRSPLDFLRQNIRTGQFGVAEDMVLGLSAAPRPERRHETTAPPCAPSEDGEISLTAKCIRLLNISIAAQYVGNAPAEFAKEKDGFCRAAKRMLIENHLHALDQDGYEARTTNISLGLSLLESASPRQALEPLWNALRVAPDESNIRQALELAGRKTGLPGVMRRLSATRMDYLGGIDLPNGIVPRDIAMAGADRIVLSDAKTQRLHVLDLVSGRVAELHTPRLAQTHSFCIDAAQNSIVLCDHVARRLAFVSLHDGSTTSVELSRLLDRDAESFSLLWVAIGPAGTCLALDLKNEDCSVVQTLSSQTHTPVGAPVHAPEGTRYVSIAATESTLFAHAAVRPDNGGIYALEGGLARAIPGSGGFIVRLAAARDHVYAVYNRSGIAKFDLGGTVLFQADLSLLVGREVGAVGVAVSPCNTRLHVADMTNSILHSFGIEDTQ